MKPGWQPNSSAIVTAVRHVNARVAIQDSIKAVADHFGIDPAMLRGPARPKHIVGPRHIAIWVAHRVSGISLPKIGREFGGRHHTTILYALRVVDDARRNHDDVKVLTDDLFASLTGRSLR